MEWGLSPEQGVLWLRVLNLAVAAQLRGNGGRAIRGFRLFSPKSDRFAPLTRVLVLAVAMQLLEAEKRRKWCLKVVSDPINQL